MHELTHPVLGVRAWYLYPRKNSPLFENTYPTAEDIPGLYSTTCATQWWPGINKAECAPPFLIPHTAFTPPCPHPPSPLCNCGLYAYHDLLMCVGHWSSYFIGGFGIIRGWGRMQLHPNGWRAQYAEVLALISGQPTPEHAAVKFWRPQTIGYLAKEFQVPVVPFDAFPAMMTEFGRSVPREMWPRSNDDLNEITF